MDDLDIAFCFPCSSCQAKFGSLRKLRKHTCDILKDITKSSTIIPIKTDNINKGLNRNKLFPREYNESISKKKDLLIKHTSPKKEVKLSYSRKSNQTEMTDSISGVSHIRSENSSTKSLQHQKDLLTENNSLECVPCNKVFPDQILYHRHQWAHNMNKHNKNIFLPCTEPDCFEIIPNSKLLNSHKSKAHGKQKTFTCSICTFSAKYECDLKRHHDRKHLMLDSCICAECGKYFKSQLALTYHMKVKYGVYDYKCQSCDFKTISDVRLEAHVMNIHSRVFSVICTECGQGFTAKCYLKRHMSIHTGEKKFKCSSCELSFRLNYYLKKHELIHLNERPFECKMCPKRFNASTNLHVHTKRHLNQKDYVCDSCKKGFIEPAGLRKHTCPGKIDV